MGRRGDNRERRVGEHHGARHEAKRRTFVAREVTLSLMGDVQNG